MFEEYPEVLNVDEACELLRCGRNRLYKLINSENPKNQLKAYKNGRVWKIPRRAIEMYILEQSRLLKG